MNGCDAGKAKEMSLTFVLWRTWEIEGKKNLCLEISSNKHRAGNYISLVETIMYMYVYFEQRTEEMIVPIFRPSVFNDTQN